jgi:hypothetical protein
MKDEDGKWRGSSLFLVLCSLFFSISGDSVSKKAQNLPAFSNPSSDLDVA